MIAKGVSAKHHHDGSDVDGQSPDARSVPAAGRQPRRSETYRAEGLSKRLSAPGTTRNS